MPEENSSLLYASFVCSTASILIQLVRDDDAPPDRAMKEVDFDELSLRGAHDRRRRRVVGA